MPFVCLKIMKFGFRSIYGNDMDLKSLWIRDICGD